MTLSNLQIIAALQVNWPTAEWIMPHVGSFNDLDWRSKDIERPAEKEIEAAYAAIPAQVFMALGPLPFDAKNEISEIKARLDKAGL